MLRASSVQQAAVQKATTPATTQMTRAKAEFPTLETTLYGCVNMPPPIVLLRIRHATVKGLNLSVGKDVKTYGK